MGKAARLRRQRIASGLEKSFVQKRRDADKAVLEAEKAKDRAFLLDHPEEAERRRKTLASAARTMGVVSRIVAGL